MTIAFGSGTEAIKIKQDESVSQNSLYKTCMFWHTAESKSDSEIILDGIF